MVRDESEAAVMLGDAGASVKERIERSFRRIETERMAGIPILNAAVRVEVVGLCRFADQWLCILITPWFMNIMLLPDTGNSDGGAASDRSAAIGSKTTVMFPAGGFDMIHGFESGIGPYGMCSLFSPMHEFADHDSAVLAAEAALAALLDVEADEEADADREMAMIWRGERPAVGGPEATNKTDERHADAAIAPQDSEASADRREVTLDRRRLLLGQGREERGP